MNSSSTPEVSVPSYEYYISNLDRAKEKVRQMAIRVYTISLFTETSRAG